MSDDPRILRQQELNRKRAMARLEAQEEKQAQLTKMFEQEHADVVAFVKSLNPGEKSGFLRDMRVTLLRFGYLTPGQLSVVERIMNERRANLDMLVPGNAMLAPQGEETVRGTIFKTAWKESKMRWGNARVLQLMVRLVDGNRVCFYATQDLMTQFYHVAGVTTDEGFTGLDVEVTAEWRMADDDPHFAIGRKPKAKLLYKPGGNAR